MVKQANDQWWVWKVVYATYDELGQNGNVDPRCVAGPLPFQLAQDIVEVNSKFFGIGWCTKPWGSK